MSQCTNCAHLQAEVLQLQATVSMLLRIIADARGECIRLANEADGITAGHVSKGRWAHADGQGKTARRILRKLEH